MDENANTTRPNAYRVEAAEKRRLAANLNSEADDLDATAKVLEAAEKTDTQTAPNEAPAEAASESEDTSSSDNKKKK